MLRTVATLPHQHDAPRQLSRSQNSEKPIHFEKFTTQTFLEGGKHEEVVIAPCEVGFLDA